MATTKRQRQKSQADLRARIERQVRAEITDELTAGIEQDALRRAKEIVCATRNTVFGPTTEHEYVPVIDGGNLSERCTICDQRRPAEFPADPSRRRVYLEMVRTPEQFGQIVAERLMMRQAEKGADFMAGLSAPMRGPDPHGRGAHHVTHGLGQAPPFAPEQPGMTPGDWSRGIIGQSFDSLVMHGRSQVVDGPPGLKGATVNRMIFDEAVPKGQAFAFSQQAIDAMLAKPATMTIKFDSDADKESFRNLHALTGMIPVVPDTAKLIIDPS